MRLLLNVLWIILGGGFLIWLEYVIGGLFEDAKRKWPGVFVEGDRIDLSPCPMK